MSSHDVTQVQRTLRTLSVVVYQKNRLKKKREKNEIDKILTGSRTDRGATNRKSRGLKLFKGAPIAKF